MTFATPLGLLALAAIPAIGAIHLFRRRFPVRPIAGLFLWQQPRQVPVEGRRFDRLPVSLSLILECLAALALALIIAGARVSSADIGQHLVVLLDDSASMAAANTAGVSARDRAVERVRREIDRMGARARVSLVLSGVRPSVLAGPAAFAVEARAALEAWQPVAAHHSLALGIRLARELAGENGRLLILSDLTPTARGEADVAHALWVSIGEPLGNVGIIAAERTIDPEEGRGSISLTVANHSGSAARRRVEVSVAGKELVAKELELPPGSSAVVLPLPAGLPPVRVALSDDALARDNVVVLAEPRPRIVAVDNRLREGRGRDALGRALDAVVGVTRSDTPHLVFVDSLQTGAPPVSVWQIAFGAPKELAAAGQPRDFVGPFLLERRHPLLLGATLGGVVWTGAAPLQSEALHPLVSAGDQLLLGLYSRGDRTSPAVIFNLDLDRTNLIRAPDWPILISNIVEMRRRSLPGPERWNYRVGEWIRVNLGRDAKAALRFRCGTIERTLPPGQQLEFLAPSPGGLLEIFEGGELLYETGVNFLDSVEADLRRRASGEIGALADAAGLPAEDTAAGEPLFWILLAIGGTAIVLNWCLLPRGGVRS
jgi:hypothetical protein